MLLDTYAFLKRIKNKCDLKFKPRPWISYLCLQKSVSVKNKLLKSFGNEKNLILKDKFYTNKNIESYSPP